MEVDRWTQLSLELDGETPVEPDPPEGVELTWLADRPDLLEALFALARATDATKREASRPGRSTSSATPASAWI